MIDFTYSLTFKSIFYLKYNIIPFAFPFIAHFIANEYDSFMT